MTDVRAVCTFAATSGLPEDAVVNTFAFDGLTVPLTAELLAVHNALSDFYNADHGAAAIVVGGYLSPLVDRGPGVNVKIYDIDVGGSPLWDDFFPLAAAGNLTPLPHEVALCLSFKADHTGVPEEVPGGAPGPAGDQHPRARRRGRIYLGPLNGSAQDLAQLGRPNLNLIDQLKGAGNDLMNNAALDVLGIDWCVASQVDGLTREVTGGWVDDAFDTQRRRGHAATSRSLFGV